MPQQYLKHEVTRILPTILDTVREELRFYNGELVPTLPGLQPGEEFIEQYRRDITGMSARYNGISTDIPTVGVTLTGNNWRVGTWIIGAEWTQFELNTHERARQAGLLNRNGIIEEKMMAMNRVISEGINKAVAFGSTNFKGFVNHSDVTVQVESTAPYTLTTQQLYEYFRDIVSDFKRDARLRGEQLTLVVPPSLYDKLGGIYDPTGLSTPYRMLTDPAMGVTFGDIVELDELSYSELEASGVTSPGTNKDRFIIYHRSPETIRRETYAFRTTSPLARPDGLHWSISAYQGTTEVIIEQPTRVRFYSINKP